MQVLLDGLTLRQLIGDVAPRDIIPMDDGNAPLTFMLGRDVYAVVRGGGPVYKDPDLHPCMNLRTQVVRAVSLDRWVRPVHVEVYVP